MLKVGPLKNVWNKVNALLSYEAVLLEFLQADFGHLLSKTACLAIFSHLMWSEDEKLGM